MSLETLSRHRCFGGIVSFHRHAAQSTACAMRFAVFTPPQAAARKVPVLTYLAGLTCTEGTFMIKGGALGLAAELGLMLVAPDTSPRGPDVPGDPDGSWDFGHGAGFYLDATQAPYDRHYKMYSYVARELPALIAAHFPADAGRQGIFGHSMGGHGALTIAFKNPAHYRSVSAFAPIAAPMRCPWGLKALPRYLGPDRAAWRAYDATELLADMRDGPSRPPLLVDVGLADQFLSSQLNIDAMEQACAAAGQRLSLRRQAGYDHGYYFVSTFMADHLRHHAHILNG
jgi:S-formylglutathione hydrolase